MAHSEFISDLEKIKENAKKHLSKGAITSNYELDLENVLALLNNALATELVCTLRYKNHYFKASELGASTAAAEFLEHANQEDGHATSLAERIQQLGGQPNFDPATLLERSHADYVNCDNLKDMIRENLIAERIAIDTYREMIKYIGYADSTTRILLEQILATEEEHADDLLEVAAEYNIQFDE